MKVETKYSPKNLDEVIFPSVAVEKRLNGYASGALSGSLLLWGPNGTGKTTVANLLPRHMYGDDVLTEGKHFADLLQLEDVEGYLKKAVHYCRLYGQEKFFLIFHEFDEAKNHQSRLWSALDNIGEDVMLIITTNNPMQVPKSLRSRCDAIEFPALSATRVLPRAMKILAAENISIPSEQVLFYLTQIEGSGDLRQYFRKLDEIIYLAKLGEHLPYPAGARKHSAHLTLAQ